MYNNKAATLVFLMIAASIGRSGINAFFLGRKGVQCLNAATSCMALSTSSSQNSVETDTSQLSSDTIAIHDKELDDQMLAEELEACNGFIIDPHWHIADWFANANIDAVVQEMKVSNVSQCLLYNPYPKVSLPFDVNTYIHSIAQKSAGRVYMLASLNTTHDAWEDHSEAEMERLREFLKKPEVLGTKLAPPHTCLKLHGPIIDDIMTVISQSDKKVLATHIGTTAFCGPLGKQLGVECNCGRDYVDPTFLEPYIRAHPDVTFVLLHSGHEFLPEDDPDHYYQFEMVDKCIRLAQHYPNVYLSLSALFAQKPDGTFKYPGGTTVARKIKQGGVAHKTFWGSDASYMQGQIRLVLISAIRAMRAAGWKAAERTAALGSLTKQVFEIPHPDEM